MKKHTQNARELTESEVEKEGAFDLPQRANMSLILPPVISPVPPTVSPSPDGSPAPPEPGGFAESPLGRADPPTPV